MWVSSSYIYKNLTSLWQEGETCPRCDIVLRIRKVTPKINLVPWTFVCLLFNKFHFSQYQEQDAGFL